MVRTDKSFIIITFLFDCVVTPREANVHKNTSEKNEHTELYFEVFGGFYFVRVFRAGSGSVAYTRVSVLSFIH